MTDKLYLIDGHALIFKMYYAFLRRPMINSKGADMSILYGFTKYILELLEKEKPSHFAISFDPPGGTFRNQLCKDYKANRPPTPQLVIDALAPLQELAKAMNIPVVMIPGYEADDVIGSLALQAAAEGLEVYMVTPDKDYGQLLRKGVYQIKPGKAGGENEILDEAAICSKYGIRSAAQVIDMLAICGDAADNVPGVKGVGEVGAGKLISKYGSVDNIYLHLEELSARQQEMFQSASGYIALSRELVTIKTDVPTGFSTADFVLSPTFGTEVADLFEKYEFNSLKKYLCALPSAKSEESKAAAEFKTISVLPADFQILAKQSGACSLICDDGTLSAACHSPKGLCTCVSSYEGFRSVLSDAGILKYGYSLKSQALALWRSNIPLNGKWMDFEIMHYLINPERSHDPAMLASSYLGLELEEPSDEPEMELSLFDNLSEEENHDHARQAAIYLLLGEKIREELGPLAKLYDSMEEKLAKVLMKMEAKGVRVEPLQLKSYTAALEREISELQEEIRREADAPQLNISSPKQVGELLFDKLKLDSKAKKNSRGQYSTDEATLMELDHPIVNKILDFRAAKKLLSTYIEPLPQYISPSDGRIHTTFNQALTATGRLSSSAPNLQNIPIRTERGREIRKAFVSGFEDGLILSADYSQIELRIMAHLSCDEHLLAAFRSGEDVHRATAAKIFHIQPSEVSDVQRRMAKTANFGIMYGISAFGLAQRLGVSRKEAKELIDGYFDSFPAIRGFIEASKSFARENGYVETLFGRRRYLPDINSKNMTIRALAERNAVNAPIQGTAADIIKLAMIEVDRRLVEGGFKSVMVLQIHDELVFDVVRGEESRLMAVVKEAMEGVLKLSIPLTVECGVGTNWLEAH